MTLLVMTTVPNEKLAYKLSKVVLENRVAACVNIIKEVSSFYWWKESIENSNEIILLIKTTDEKYQDLESLIKKNHPYEVPEIIAIELKKGLNEYLNWIVKETSSLP